jgi:hypothetical protein
MEPQLTKKDIEEIVAIHISRKSLSKDRRRRIYVLIKSFIVENKISKKRYQITKYKNYKDLQIDPEYLSLEVLLEILDISEYKVF